MGSQVLRRATWKRPQRVGLRERFILRNDFPGPGWVSAQSRDLDLRNILSPGCTQPQSGLNLVSCLSVKGVPNGRGPITTLLCGLGVISLLPEAMGG